MQYQVKDPQGNLHIIEGPEGATPEQVLQQAQNLLPSTSQNTFSASPSLGDYATGAKMALSTLPQAQIPSEIGGIAQDVAQSAKEKLYDIPKAAISSVGQMAEGQPLGQTDLSKFATEKGVQALGLGLSVKQAMTEHPVESVIDYLHSHPLEFASLFMGTPKKEVPLPMGVQKQLAGLGDVLSGNDAEHYMTLANNTDKVIAAKPSSVTGAEYSAAKKAAGLTEADERALAISDAAKKRIYRQTLEKIDAVNDPKHIDQLAEQFGKERGGISTHLPGQIKSMALEYADNPAQGADAVMKRVERMVPVGKAEKPGTYDDWQKAIDERHDELEKQGVPFEKHAEDTKLNSLYEKRDQIGQKELVDSTNSVQKALQKHAITPDTQNSIIKNVYHLDPKSETGQPMAAKYGTASLEDRQQAVKDIFTILTRESAKGYSENVTNSALLGPLSPLTQEGKNILINNLKTKASQIENSVFDSLQTKPSENLLVNKFGEVGTAKSMPFPTEEIAHQVGKSIIEDLKKVPEFNNKPNVSVADLLKAKKAGQMISRSDPSASGLVQSEIRNKINPLLQQMAPDVLEKQQAYHLSKVKESFMNVFPQGKGVYKLFRTVGMLGGSFFHGLGALESPAVSGALTLGASVASRNLALAAPRAIGLAALRGFTPGAINPDNQSQLQSARDRLANQAATGMVHYRDTKYAGQ